MMGGGRRASRSGTAGEAGGRKQRAWHGSKSSETSSRRCSLTRWNSGSVPEAAGCKAHGEGDLSNTFKVVWGYGRRKMIPCFNVLLGDYVCADVIPRRTRP